MARHGPRVCMYCLAKYHLRLVKYDDAMCDIEWQDKYGNNVEPASAGLDVSNNPDRAVGA